MLTRKEKAWFFLSCGNQPKINELIYLLIFRRPISGLRKPWGCRQSGASPDGRGFSWKTAGA
ncbi:hypothetical protein E2L00_13265 [Cedecea colo]|uniref:Uncharacterized protein n=1 Tax=Cedecea colo TaxID=2552946 RepID=A0ABX0VN35_9ENTR|nr:hypothetical protein [Cedecea colo]